MATEITKAVQWLKGNIAGLEALAAESEKIGDMRAEAAAVAKEIGTLKAQRDKVQADLEATARTVSEAATRRAEQAQAAERLANDRVRIANTRLEDLQRQQKAYEDQLALLRAALEESGRLRALKEEEHLAALRDIDQRGVKAAAELLKTQEKIKALHQHLAGAPA